MRRGFDALAELSALFEHDAVDGCGQRQRSTQFAWRDAGQRQALPAFAGLRGGLAGGRTRGLQARLGDQAFGKKLLVALQALLQQGRLAAGLQRVALQFERLRAGEAGQHLAFFDGSAGGDGEHFEHAGDRGGDDAHLLVGNQHAGRINARALCLRLADDCRFDAERLDLRGLQQKRFPGACCTSDQGEKKCRKTRETGDESGHGWTHEDAVLKSSLPRLMFP